MRRKKSFFRIYSLAPLALLCLTGPLTAETIKIGGTGGAMGVMQALGQALKSQHRHLNVEIVRGLGSGGGRKALMAGVLDVAATSKAGKSVEKLQGAVAYLYGRSPLVFAVAQKNPAENLTVQDIVDIYNGKKTHWPNGDRLRLILRPESDSDADLLKSISPEMEQALKNAFMRDGMKIAVTDEDSANAIESTPGAVGSSVVSLILSEKRALKALPVNAVVPGVKTITEGSYPWFKSFYLVTRAEPPAPARLFVEFVLSAKGRQVLASLGHWIPDAKISQ